MKMYYHQIVKEIKNVRTSQVVAGSNNVEEMKMKKLRKWEKILNNKC